MKHLLLGIIFAVGCSTPFEPEQGPEVEHSEFAVTNMGYMTSPIPGGYSILVTNNVIRIGYGTDKPSIIFSAFLRDLDGRLELVAEDSATVECAPPSHSIDFVSKTIGFERPFQNDELSRTILTVRVQHKY